MDTRQCILIQITIIDGQETMHIETNYNNRWTRDNAYWYKLAIYPRVAADSFI
jgi:hypothetical protein